jgi:hypothetical protein
MFRLLAQRRRHHDCRLLCPPPSLCLLQSFIRAEFITRALLPKYVELNIYAPTRLNRAGVLRYRWRLP